jgi:hypothetical protein
MSRADAQLSMRVEGGSADGALTPIVTESRNVSGSGVYCISPHYLAPLSKVALTIVLPHVPGRIARQRLLKCEGMVVRCQSGEGSKRDRGYELACCFLDLEPGARELLDEYVVWRNLQALRSRPRTTASRRAAAGGSRSTQATRASGPGRRGTATRAAASRSTGTRKRRTVH